MREAQKVEGLGFAVATFLLTLRRIAAELDQTRLVGMKLQMELAVSLPQGDPELLGIRAVIATAHGGAPPPRTLPPPTPSPPDCSHFLTCPTTPRSPIRYSMN